MLQKFYGFRWPTSGHSVAFCWHAPKKYINSQTSFFPTKEPPNGEPLIKVLYSYFTNRCNYILQKKLTQKNSTYTFWWEGYLPLTPSLTCPFLLFWCFSLNFNLLLTSETSWQKPWKLHPLPWKKKHPPSIPPSPSNLSSTTHQAKAPKKTQSPSNQLMVWLVGLRPGGLDSERIPENERDWDSWVYPDSNPKPPGPKPTINH